MTIGENVIMIEEDQQAEEYGPRGSDRDTVMRHSLERVSPASSTNLDKDLIKKKDVIIDDST